MKNRLLLTTVIFPFPTLPQQEAATDVMGQRFTRGNDLLTMVSHTHPPALHLLAQNLRTPSVVLEYPRWRQFCREVALGYEIIGISAYPFHLEKVLRMCRHIRAVSPGTKILVGSYAAQTLKSLGGLEVYGEIIDDLVDEEGVAYLRRLLGEDIQQAVTQRFFPKNGAGLRYLGKYPRGNTVLLFSGLGCPGGCDFCSTSAMYRRERIELLSPQNVVEHIRHYLNQAPGLINQFYLIDEDYFRYPEYLLALRRLIAKDPSILSQADFVAFGSVDYIASFAREHGWDAIAETGIGVIFIGVESQCAGGHGYDKRDGADPKEVFTQLHRMGIRTIGAWIAGFPFQNRQTLHEDLEYFISCYPTYQQMAIFSPFPGTPLHDSLPKKDAVHQCQFADYHFWNPSSSHPEFDNRELLEITERGYTLGYQTWGSCLQRNLDIHLNGIEHCRKNQSSTVHSNALQLHRKNATKIYTQMRVMARYAPNSEVEQKVRDLQRRYSAILGQPPFSQEVVSWVSLLLAVSYKWRTRLFRWTPKVEGFRRYQYDPANGAPGMAPYTIDHFASLDLWFRLKRLLPDGVKWVAEHLGFGCLHRRKRAE